MKASLSLPARPLAPAGSTEGGTTAPQALRPDEGPREASRLSPRSGTTARAQAPTRRLVETENPSSSEFINFSHADRARVFDYVASYNQPGALKRSMRISNKGVSELSESKHDDPLKNYQHVHHIGAGLQGTVSTYEHKGQQYAVKTYGSGRSSENEMAILAALTGPAREGVPRVKKILIGGGHTHIVMERLTPIPGFGTYGDVESRLFDERLGILVHDRGDHNAAIRTDDPTATHDALVDIDFGRSEIDLARVQAVLRQRGDDEVRITELIQRRQLTDVRFTDVDCTGFDFAGNKLSTTQVQDILAAARKIGVTPTLKGADLSDVNTEGIVFTQARLDDAQVKQILGSTNAGRSLNYAVLENVDLTGQNLTDVDVADTYFGGAKLDGEQVRQITETAARRQTSPNFSGAVLTEGLQGAVLHHQDALWMIGSANRLKHVPDLRGAVIRDIGEISDFNGARIDAQQVQQVVDSAWRGKRTAPLQGADLSTVDAADVDFKRTPLHTRQVSDLIQAARDANKRPVLRRADLTRVDFAGLDLNGVKFDRCKVDWPSITQATDWRQASFGLAGTLRKLIHRG